MHVLGIVLLVLTSGCTYTHVSYSSASTTSSGTAVSTSSGSLQVQGGRPLAFVLLGGLLIATAVDGEPRPVSFSDWGWRSAPEMNPDRAINEQDCTKPIELTENLRCK
jgi:hypothetical protein